MSRGAEGARAALPGRPELRVRVVSKSLLPYTPSTLGLPGHHVGIVIENVSGARVALGALRASFLATRDGVAFPCRPFVGPAGGEREPRSLAPLESHLFERDLDCQLTLPGRYDVEVRLALVPDGGEPTAVPAAKVGALRLELEPRGDRLPQPHPAVPGLWALMTGDSTARPLRDEAWAKGAYGVVVALVNASPREIDVSGARVLFRVYKVGTTLPCMDEPVVLKAPRRLAPGTTHFERVPITCIMNKHGSYDIDSALLVGEDAREAKLGRIRLSVGPDPTIVFPPHVY